MNERWQLDKHVPLAVILAMLIQTATAIWWAATINAEVTTLKEKVAIIMGDHERLVRVEPGLETLKSLSAMTLEEVRELKREMKDHEVKTLGRRQ